MAPAMDEVGRGAEGEAEAEVEAERNEDEAYYLMM